MVIVEAVVVGAEVAEEEAILMKVLLQKYAVSYIVFFNSAVLSFSRKKLELSCTTQKARWSAD